MGLSLYVVLGSAVVGLLVGLTGAGGGALMTPMLILLFSVKPAAAISSDLVAAVVMRPVGAAVHLHKGTVNLRMVGLMTLGSVPMAFLGSFLLREMDGSKAGQQHVEIALGAALLVGASAMVFRYLLDRRSGRARTGAIREVTLRPVPTVLIGMIGGLIVGITSVGAGSLMIILLLFTYPLLSAGQLDHRRQRARGADRLAALLARAGQVHPAGHHLRDLRVRAEVRGRADLPAGLRHGRHPGGRRGLLAGRPAATAAAARGAGAGPGAGGSGSGAGRTGSARRRSGQIDRRSARVLLHEGADGRQRGRDVLGGVAADAAVGLDDRGPVGGRCPRVGHRQQ